jgi:ketosteroid isomerase-like protein
MTSSTMTSTPTMTDDQRQAIASAYLHAVDHGGQLPDGGSILDLFAADAQVSYPKWGLATGTDAIGRLFREVGRTITHDHASITWITTGTDLLVAEGTSHGQHRDGPWRAGRWCDVFAIRAGKIHRCFVYLDPDYAGRDTDRYPWLQAAAWSQG